MEQHTINCIFKQLKQITMKDLLDYYRFRNEALQSRVCELENLLSTLETYCFELADDDCPKEYKTIIKKELYNLKTK